MHGGANRGRLYFDLTGITCPSAGRPRTPRRALSPHQAWIPRRRRCSLLEPADTTDDPRASFYKSHPTSRRPSGTEPTGPGQTLGGGRLPAQGALTGTGRTSQARRGRALRERLLLAGRQGIERISSLTLLRAAILVVPRRPLPRFPSPQHKPGTFKILVTCSGWFPPGVILVLHPSAPCPAHNKSLTTGMLEHSAL